MRSCRHASNRVVVSGRMVCLAAERGRRRPAESSPCRRLLYLFTCFVFFPLADMTRGCFVVFFSAQKFVRRTTRSWYEYSHTNILTISDDFRKQRSALFHTCKRSSDVMARDHNICVASPVSCVPRCCTKASVALLSLFCCSRLRRRGQNQSRKNE